jgi:tetratricopeptide (TPR) repeat protein
MNAENKKLFNRRGSASHFLFSKTDTDRLKDVKKTDIIDADEAIRSAFPNMRSCDDFIDFANQQLDTLEKFSALVIRPDQEGDGAEPSNRPQSNEGHALIAAILDRFFRREKGWWGPLDAGLLGLFLPLRNKSDSIELARDFQKHLMKKTGKTVTIGVASFPTITYEKPEILNNACKALDHATFFGVNSLVAFDDISLNISGDKFYENGNIQEAIKEFKLALELDPNNVNVHNSLGVCYGLQSDYDLAITEFQKAIAIDPGEYMALYNLGLVHLLIEQRDRALAYFLDANKINGNNYEVAFQTGKLYFEAANFNKSRVYLERAVELEPESAPVYRYLGDCYAAARLPEAAISAYKKAIKYNPHDAAAMSALGKLFDNQGENAEITLMFLRESVALAPENGLFHHRLGRYFSKRHRLNDALKEFVKAKSLGYDAAEDIKTIKDRKKAEK